MAVDTAQARRWLRHRIDERWSALDFWLELPEDWTFDAPAGGPIDFEHEHARLMPLLEAQSGDGAMRLTIGARPSVMVTPLVYSATYLMREHGIELEEDGDDRSVGSLAAISGPAWRLGADRRREALWYAYCEDGARLLHLCLSGPVAQQERLLPMWQRLLLTFRLVQPRGQSQSLLGAPPRPANNDPGPPAWWVRAQELERLDRLDEALAVVGQECTLAGSLLARAELLARQMRRRALAGDLEGAREAHQRAEAFAWSYAAGATSGGEGAALSMERDRFLAELGPRP